MNGLSHLQIIEAIVDIAHPVMAAVMAQDATIHAESDDNASEQIKCGVIEVMKQPGSEPLGVDAAAQWPPMLAKTSRHNRLIFIALVRAIYN